MPVAVAGVIARGEAVGEWAGAAVELHGVQAGDNRFRCKQVADPHARREDLGERCGTHHAAGRRHRVDGRDAVAREAQLAVRVVLEDDEVVEVGEFGEAMAPGERQVHAGGIVEVRDGVDEFRRRSRVLQFLELRLEEVDAHAVVVECDAVGLRLKLPERTQTTHERWRLADGGVSNVEECLRDDRESVV